MALRFGTLVKGGEYVLDDGNINYISCSVYPFTRNPTLGGRQHYIGNEGFLHWFISVAEERFTLTNEECSLAEALCERIEKDDKDRLACLLTLTRIFIIKGGWKSILQMWRGKFALDSLINRKETKVYWPNDIPEIPFPREKPILKKFRQYDNKPDEEPSDQEQCNKEGESSNQEQDVESIPMQVDGFSEPEEALMDLPEMDTIGQQRDVENTMEDILRKAKKHIQIQIRELLQQKKVDYSFALLSEDSLWYNLFGVRSTCPVNDNLEEVHTPLYVSIRMNGKLILGCSKCQKKEEIGELDLHHPDLTPFVEGLNFVPHAYQLNPIFPNHRCDNSWVNLHQKGVQYIETAVIPDLDCWMAVSDTLVIKSSMDTQKTGALCRYIKSHPELKRVLMVSFRQSLTDNTFGRFHNLEFEDYRGKTPVEIQHTDRLIIQLDSLHKLYRDFIDGSDPLKAFDLIVMDEITATMGHLDWKGMKHRKSNANVLAWHVNHASKFIALCADYDYKAAEFVTDLRKDALLVWNTAAAPIKKTITVAPTKEWWYEEWNKVIQNRKRVALITNTVKFANAQVDVLVSAGVPREKILLITADTRDKVKEQIQNCNNSWIEFDYVIFTPTIEAGLDFHQEHFDFIFAWGSRTSNTASLFNQQLGRIRKTKDILLWADNDACPGENAVLTLGQLTEQVTIRTINYIDDPYIKDWIKCEFDMQSGRFKFVKPEQDTFFKIACHNRLEQENSEYYFKTLLLTKLRNMGYEIKEPEDTGNTEEGIKLSASIKEIRKAQKRKAEEEFLMVEAEKPEEGARTMTVANQAYEYDQFFHLRDAHKDAEFVERWPNEKRGCISNAKNMLWPEEIQRDSEKIDIYEDKTRLVAPKTTPSLFKEAVEELFKAYGLESIFSDHPIVPDESAQRAYFAKLKQEDDGGKEKKRTLGLSSKHEHAKPITPLRHVLKEKFNLHIQEEKRSHKKKKPNTPSQQTEYRINQDQQKELAQIIARYQAQPILMENLQRLVPAEWLQT